MSKEELKLREQKVLYILNKKSAHKFLTKGLQRTNFLQHIVLHFYRLLLCKGLTSIIKTAVFSNAEIPNKFHFFLVSK